MSLESGGAEAEPIIFPKLDDVRAAINGFLLDEKWDRHKIGRGPKRFLRSISKLVAEHLGYLPHVVQPDTELPEWLFYRTRIASRHFNEQLIGDYSFPPSHVIRSYQRCNIPHYPVFYCSDSPGTSMFEAASLMKERATNPPCYLSEWKLRDGVKVNVTPFLFGNVNRDSPFWSFSEDNVKRIRGILRGRSEEEIDGFVEVMKYLSALFAYDNTYSITAYIAHTYLYAPHSLRTDILMYPSIQTKLRSVNFAVHPNCVQHSMELVRVYKYFVRGTNEHDQMTNVALTHTGTNVGGIIRWRPFDKDDEANRALLSRVGQG